MEHVEVVIPSIHESCRAAWDGRQQDVLVSAPDPGDPRYNARLVAGSPLPASGPFVLVHEFLLYQWGITDDEEVKDVVGQTLRLEYRSRGPLTTPVLGLMTGAGASLSPTERDALEAALNQLARTVDRLDLTAAQKDLLRRVLGVDMGARRPAETVV